MSPLGLTAQDWISTHSLPVPNIQPLEVLSLNDLLTGH